MRAYALFTLVSMVVLIAGQRLDQVDLSAPFTYEQDALLILPMVKATIEGGTHWVNHRLGAPGIQELHDFPVVDHLHFAIIWLIGQFTPDAVVAYNLFHLLTYPLTVLTAMLVLRHFGLSVPAAGVGGVLYAFLPYHYLRGENHYFLAAYYVVPLTLLVAMWFTHGRLPGFRRENDGRYRIALWNRDVLIAVLIALATATAGAYYAFFACALYVVAAAYGWLTIGTWRVMASAGFVIAVVVLMGIAQHVPSILYQKERGSNPGAIIRSPVEAEFYGLKLAHLLLPVENHQSRTLAAITNVYDSESRPSQNENTTATLGFIGSIGLVSLLAISVFPIRRTWPLGPLATLTLFAVLLTTIGGFGAVLNLISSQIRGYNRISIYIAFLALFAVLWMLDRFLAQRPGWVRWTCFLLLGAFGIWDQCGRPWFRAELVTQRAEITERYHTDAAFFGQLDKAMPNGMIFTLPYMPYPEGAPEDAYENVRGYLHTDTIRWSFGAMKQREIDRWQWAVSNAPPAEMLRQLVIRGFDGLFLDARHMDPTRVTEIVDASDTLVGSPAPRFTHPDGQQMVLDLRPLEARLIEELGESQFQELRLREAEAIQVLWLSGFVSFEQSGEEWKHRWCGRSGTVVFINPTDRPRTVHLDMVFGTGTEEPSDLVIDGGSVWSDQFGVTNHAQRKEWTITLPPGHTPVEFRCKLPSQQPLPGIREDVFFIALFQMTEVEP